MHKLTNMACSTDVGVQEWEVKYKINEQQQETEKHHTLSQWSKLAAIEVTDIINFGDPNFLARYIPLLTHLGKIISAYCLQATIENI